MTIINYIKPFKSHINNKAKNKPGIILFVKYSLGGETHEENI